MRALRPALLHLAWPICCIIQIAFYAGTRHDDAFISFRYGQNLALGNGMVFNVGERLMGSTSPGEVLLSALVYALVGQASTPSVMAALGCMAWTAQAIAVRSLLRTAVGPACATIVSACVLADAARSGTYVALETNLAVALTLWAFVFAEHQRFTRAALLCGLAAVVRPDTLIATTLIGGVALFKLRARIATPALAFGIPALAWVIFAWSYFGSILPRSAREVPAYRSGRVRELHARPRQHYLARAVSGGLILACCARADRNRGRRTRASTAQRRRPRLL